MARLKKSDLDSFIELADRKVASAEKILQQKVEDLHFAQHARDVAIKWREELKQQVAALGHDVED